jgi:predicted dinucleotide-binding enzyme
MVGQAIGGRLASLGHDVMMGSRDAANAKAAEFAARTGGRAGTFEDAAAFAEMVVLAARGDAALAVLTAAGADNLRGKVVVDVTLPLDFSNGFPPSLTVSNTDSLGETLQREFPDARFVKTLNTINAAVMVDPASLPGDHVVFVCGNDDAAKAEVTALLRSFGWRAIIDLGDLSNARATEQYLPLWVRLMRHLGTPVFNVALVTATPSAA